MLFWAKKMQQHSFVVVYDGTKRRPKWRRKRRRWKSSSWLNKLMQTIKHNHIGLYNIQRDNTILFDQERGGIATAIFYKQCPISIKQLICLLFHPEYSCPQPFSIQEQPSILVWDKKQERQRESGHQDNQCFQRSWGIRPKFLHQLINTFAVACICFSVHQHHILVVIISFYGQTCQHSLAPDADIPSKDYEQVHSIALPKILCKRS